jgi:DNA repair exonuclease SbcCD ATPase subunit
MGKPTKKQLQAWFKELEKYEAILREWDARLDDKEAMLEGWEAELLAFTEEHSEEFEDQCPVCGIDHNDEEQDEECFDTFSNLVHSGVVDVKTQKDIIELEKLYSLPDKRRSRK